MLIKSPQLFYWLRTNDEYSDIHHLSFNSFSIYATFYQLKYWKWKYYINWFPSCKEIHFPWFTLIIQKQYNQ